MCAFLTRCELLCWIIAANLERPDIVNRYFAAVAFSFIVGPAHAAAQEKPPANFENWGVCPFECCTYREWTAEDEIPIHQNRSEKSAVVFRLRRQEHFDAVTGVVVTEKPGVVRIDRPVQDGYLEGSDQPQLSLKAGDTIYLLSPLGEGAYLFWYRGKVYRSSTDLAAMPGVDAAGARMTWWKQVRNKAGKKGWTLSDKFSNADACG